MNLTLQVRPRIGYYGNDYRPSPATKADLKALAAYISTIADEALPMIGEFTVGCFTVLIEEAE